MAASGFDGTPLAEKHLKPYQGLKPFHLSVKSLS